MFEKFNFINKNKDNKSNQKQEELKVKKQNEKLNRQKQREESRMINELVINWQNTFGNLKNWNQERNGYTLSHIQVHDYGFSCRIYAPWGMSIFDIEKYKPIIDSGLKCESLFVIPQHNEFVMAKFIYPEKVKINEQMYIPVKVKPWEFCGGFDMSGEPIIFNINDTPQILIGGMQRKGKNGSADTSIINWIYSCDETEITFYMFQCAGNDLVKYKDCKQVYCYTNKLDEMLIALEHIYGEMQRRSQLFAPMIARAEGNDNIFHYNKLYPQNKLPYIIIVIDEFISLMPDDKVDGNEVKNKKNMIMKYLQNIAQWGGKNGIDYEILHQKPEKALMNSFLKNQSSIRICFGFEDLVCCAIVLGDELAKYAHKLPPRKAFYSNNESNGYLYTKNLKGQIRKYIEASIKPNHRTLFTDLEKLKEDKTPKLQNEVPESEAENILQPSIDNGTAPLPIKIKEINKDEIISEKETKLDENQVKIEEILLKEVKIPQTNIVLNPQLPDGDMEFSNVDPFKIQINNEKILKNIKNIPNFVPYEPNKRKIVIDETKLNLSNSQKIIKDNDEGKEDK